MPALRIWINRTYATFHHQIRMLEENPDHRAVHVVATHRDPDSPVLAAAAEAYPELDGLGDDYVEAALAFCTRHAIDVLWPTWQAEAIAARRGDFEALGVRVLTSPPEAIRLFEDKAAAYAAAARLGVPVPEHHVATTAAEFEAAYGTMVGNGHAEICMKPVTGVGAAGFWIISTEPPSLGDLYAAPRRRMPLAQLRGLIQQCDTFAPLMVMPVLPGGEYSVDTLSHDGKVGRTVPRFKSPTSRRVLLDAHPELEAYTRLLVEEHGLSYLSNVQFRLDEHGRPFLLEVNTRASGGLFQSCLAGGNLVWPAVRSALEGYLDPAWLTEPSYPVALTTFATATRLDARSAGQSAAHSPAHSSGLPQIGDREHQPLERVGRVPRGPLHLGIGTGHRTDRLSDAVRGPAA